MASRTSRPDEAKPPTDAMDRGPAIEDLEPVDGRGNPIAWWSATVQARNAASLSSQPSLRPSGSQQSLGVHSNQACGRNFIRIPEEAVLGEGSYGLVWRAK